MAKSKLEKTIDPFSRTSGFFIGFALIGLGLGLYFDSVGSFLFLGLGFGFVVTAIIEIFVLNRKKQR